MLPKSTIIIALVFASAVLVPLRKARGAFGPNSTLPGLTNAPRVSMRRRPSRPRPDCRIEPGVVLRDLATCAGATVNARGRDTGARTVGTTSGKHPAARQARVARRFRAVRATALRPSSVSHDSGRPHSHHDGDRMIDRVGYPSHRDQFSTPAPAPRLAAATQAVGDIPDPPPKHRA